MINELYRIKDQYGEIIVTEQAGKRILSFGSSLQQSAIYTDKPYELVHEYTQMMLLSLIFVSAKKITLLGLGGGGIAHCLNHYYPQLKLQAVELRQAVIDAAYQWFDLPDNNLKVICGEAFEYMQQLKENSTDIIFSDLYEAQGMSDAQSQGVFIASAYHALSENACLVINFHQLPADDSDVMVQIRRMFSEVYMCDIFCGNWIVYCIKSERVTDDGALKSRLAGLAKKVDYPMKYYFKQLRKINN